MSIIEISEDPIDLVSLLDYPTQQELPSPMASMTVPDDSTLPVLETLDDDDEELIIEGIVHLPAPQPSVVTLVGRRCPRVANPAFPPSTFSYDPRSGAFVGYVHPRVRANLPEKIKAFDDNPFDLKLDIAYGVYLGRPNLCEPDRFPVVVRLEVLSDLYSIIQDVRVFWNGPNDEEAPGSMVFEINDGFGFSTSGNGSNDDFMEHRQTAASWMINNIGNILDSGSITDDALATDPRLDPLNWNGLWRGIANAMARMRKVLTSSRRNIRQIDAEYQCQLEKLERKRRADIAGEEEHARVKIQRISADLKH